MSKIINGVASEYDFPFKDFDVRYDEESIQTFNRWQDPTIEEYKKEIERLNNIIDENNEKAAKIIMKMTTEIDRLNKIIDELEKWLEERLERFYVYEPYGTPTGIPNYSKTRVLCNAKELLDKLKELKDKNE